MTQPIDTLHWVNPTQLHANGYNPNHVAPREMDLLALSITATGWTQPIVADPDGTIVDGFHRWHLALTRPDVTAATDGLVPVVHVVVTDTTRRLATIRHNRARGTHFVKQMAVIVAELLDAGEDPADVGDWLGMERVEVDRLAQFGRGAERNAGDELTAGWVPRPAGAKVAR
jgi:ParB-like chromosome segregation protein Spo0J